MVYGQIKRFVNTLPYMKSHYNNVLVLQDIDAARTRGLQDDDYQNRLHSTVSKYLPLRNEEDVKKDVVSLFILTSSLLSLSS
jgi:hypothetical protein